MRTTRQLRAPKAAHLAAGALILAVPATAVAVSQADAQATPSGSDSLHATLADTHVAYGREVTVRGTAPAADAGERVNLQFEAAGSSTWRPMGSTTIGDGGGFWFDPRLTRSGVLEIVPSSGATAASPHSVSASSSPSSGSASSPTTGEAALVPSAAEPIQVDARLRVSAQSRDVLAGSPVSIRGRLLSGSRGSLVRLMTRRGAGWTTLASTRTGPAGGFDLRYVVPSTGRSWVRVAFAGNQDNGAAWARAGELVGLRQSVVSWYYDGGDTACGFHATYGVASRTLPCGTQVTFVYDGRSVTATVDDRGPYVYTRDYDLNQNTAAALGVSGVATVLSSI